MRWIFTRKAYRAFPELDQYSDQQCKSILKFLDNPKFSTAKSGYKAISAVWLGWFLWGILVLFIASHLESYRLPQHEMLFDLIWVTTFLIPMLTWLFVVNRILLHRQIKHLLQHKFGLVKCIECKYPLMGLKMCGPHHVKCPECGAINNLEAIGVSEEDLRKFDQLIIPKETSNDRPTAQ